MKETINELKKQIIKLEKPVIKLKEKLAKLEDEKIKKKNSKLIGKCFKYRNSYSSGEKWWLYTKVIGVTDYDRVKTVNFQKTSYNDIEIKTGDSYPHMLGTKITAKEFHREFEKLWNEIKGDLNE